MKARDNSDDANEGLRQEDAQRHLAGRPRGASVAGADRTLRNIGLLRDVGAATLVEMDRRCRWQELQEGDVLIAAGVKLDRIFFLLSGEVRFSLPTRVGKMVSLPPAPRGSLIDATGLVDRIQVPYSVEAVGPCTVASLGARTFMELAERDLGLMQAMVATLIDRQHTLVRNIVELSTLSVRARIHSELLRLCRERQVADGSAVIHPVPTHAELANRVGTHREAVSREMSHLQQFGVLRRQDGTLFIPSVSRLAELQAQSDD